MSSPVNPVDQTVVKPSQKLLDQASESSSATQFDAPALLTNILQQLLSSPALASNNPIAADHPDTTHHRNSPMDSQVLQQLAQDPRVINVLFDAAERIYDCIDPALQQMMTAHDLPLVQILKQGRVVRDYSLPLLSLPLLSFEQGNSDQTVSDLTVSVNDGLYQSQTHEQLQNPAQPACWTVYRANNDQSADHFKFPFRQGFKPYAAESACVSSTSNDSANSSPSVAVSSEIVIKPSLADSALTDPAPPKKVIKMPHFQIANARVGQAYSANLKIQGDPQQAVHLKPDSVRITSGANGASSDIGNTDKATDEANEIGIRYDPELDQFSGVPQQAGEYSIQFYYQQAKQWLAGQCAFIITADPRSLWQVNEPPTDAAYAKPHLDAALIQQMPEGANATLIAASRRGRSHEHAGSFRDDDFLIAHIADSSWSILAVADGAGSAEFSREGSRIAVQAAGQVLTDYLEQNRQQLDAQLENWQMGTADESSKQAAQALYHRFHDVFYQVAQTAIADIEQQASQQQRSTKAFATTLLVAVVRHHQAQTFVSTFWIGDGAIAVYSPDKVRLMGNPDSGEFAGQTRFLDKSVINGFNERVNIGYFEQVSAVILMTDGISDPKFETDSGLQNPQKWNALWHELQQPLSQPNPEQALLDWLHFFCAGHHDDRTLALLSTQKLGGQLLD